jgi:hypothetical protein
VSIQKKYKWWIAIAATLVVVVIGVFISASILAKRFEPYIKEQAVQYLSQRFQSEVEVGNLAVNIPRIPPVQLFLTRGEGVIAEVVGSNIVMRHKGRRDIPPMMVMKGFRFSVDLGRVFDPTKRVALIHLSGLQLHIPPKGDRPKLGSSETPAGSGDNKAASTVSSVMPKASDILIEKVMIEDSKLVILPKSADRKPLEFDLHQIVLDSVQLKESLNYKALLTNAKPPGLIDSQGSFGPWNAETPSDTPLSGKYTFSNADLGVFSAIGGTLHSTGSFEGVLNSIEAKGVADVPNFHLKKVGHPVNLHTEFEALVDGGNGNTTLKPVKAMLETSALTTSGAIIKHDGDARRTIDLNFAMPNGEMLDLLKLAMKNKPFLSGRIHLNGKIRIPPFAGDVKEKLILDGKFAIERGQFLQDVVQDKIDTLSRRGQGQPKSTEIDNVFSNMAGEFHLDNQQIDFRSLSFSAPGARVDLVGGFDMDKDILDFNGSLKLDARVSQTMTGWKRWALKPVDPFFAKKGAGTFLKIKVSGSSKQPQFGASR